MNDYKCSNRRERLPDSMDFVQNFNKFDSFYRISFNVIIQCYHHSYQIQEKCCQADILLETTIEAKLFNPILTREAPENRRSFSWTYELRSWWVDQEKLQTHWHLQHAAQQNTAQVSWDSNFLNTNAVRSAWVSWIYLNKPKNPWATVLR